MNTVPPLARKASSLRIGVSMAAALLCLGTGMETSDRLLAWALRSRLDHLYSVKASLRPGMTRDAVESTLRAAARTWFEPRPLEGDALSAYVHYSLFEGCYLTLTFEGTSLRGAHTGLSTRPGLCPGAPLNWREGARHAGN
jgi:hypothetical protein